MTWGEKFAFYINAYNLTVIKAVIEQIKKNPEWKGIVSKWMNLKFFILKKFTVANKRMSLASASCPVIFSRLVKAEKLEIILTDAADFFVNTPSNVHYDKESKTLFLSKIFQWYKNDFEYKGGILKFLKEYYKGDLEWLNYENIKYFTYDWSLNSLT